MREPISTVSIQQSHIKHVRFVLQVPSSKQRRASFIWLIKWLAGWLAGKEYNQDESC